VSDIFEHFEDFSAEVGDDVGLPFEVIGAGGYFFVIDLL